MTETMPRSLLALTGIVALIAISVGIKDYVQQPKQAKPPTNMSTPTAVQSNAEPKKTTSAKTRHSRMSAREANAHAPAQTAADNMEKPLTSEEFADSGAAIVVIGNAPNTVGAPDKGEAALDRNNRVSNELNTRISRSAVSAPQCLPLPNLIKSGDVDASYYRNWAREYLCGISR